MDTVDRIADYVKSGDWNSDRPPNKDEILDELDCSKRILTRNQDKLEKKHGITIIGPDRKISSYDNVKLKENLYVPPNYSIERNQRTGKLKVKRLLKEMFLEDLRSISHQNAFDKKIETWKKGKIKDDKIREITASISGKTLNEVENDILDLVSATAEEARKKRKQEVRQERIENTKEISKDDIEEAVFGRLYYKPKESSKSREEFIKKWEKGEFDEVKSHVANRAFNLEKNSDIFEEKFDAVIDTALRRIKEGEEPSIF